MRKASCSIDSVGPYFGPVGRYSLATIANLDGEYRIERIIGENEMICRLYGPKTPGESWNLVPLGENAVWLSGVPTKGHVDGERVRFSGLLAVRGTQRCRVHDDVYETYFRVEPAAVDSMHVDAALGAAAMADDENPEMHERLNALRKLAGLPLVGVRRDARDRR